MKPIRINIYGGPGSGKSTVAAWLFGELKSLNIPCELAREYVKNWAYEKRKVENWDQVYIMGKQILEEHRLIKAGVEVIISDSPVALSCVYGRMYFKRNKKMIEGIDAIVQGFLQECENVNVVLRRPESYEEKGRYESKKAAERIDREIHKIVRTLHGGDYRMFSCCDRSPILSFAMSVIRWFAQEGRA